MLFNRPQTSEQRERVLRRGIFASSYSGCRPTADEIDEAGQEHQTMIWILADLAEDFSEIYASEAFARFRAAIAEKTVPQTALLEAEFDQDQLHQLRTELWNTPEFGLQFLNGLYGFVGTTSIGRARFEEAEFGAEAFLDDEMYHQALLLQVLLQQAIERYYLSLSDLNTA